MEKIIQFTAKDEQNAFEIIKKLKSLDDTSEISLQEYYVFNKDENGKTHLKSEQSDVLEGTLFGTLTGGFFGILFGPVGLLLGSSFGALTGSTIDLVSSLNKDEYLQKITKDLPKNTTVVVARVVEEWTVPIDSTIENLAEIKRADVDDEIEKLIGNQIDELEQEIEKAEEDAKNAVDNAREKYQERVNELKAKRDERLKDLNLAMQAQQKSYHNWTEKIKAKGVEFGDNIQHRINNINNQIQEVEENIKTAVGDARKNYENRIEELKQKRDRYIKNVSETINNDREKYRNWVQKMRDRITK